MTTDCPARNDDALIGSRSIVPARSNKAMRSAGVRSADLNKSFTGSSVLRSLSLLRSFAGSRPVDEPHDALGPDRRGRATGIASSHGLERGALAFALDREDREPRSGDARVGQRHPAERVLSGGVVVEADQ